MNRHQRRTLKTAVRRQVGTLAHPVPESVTLAGGPMDGWVVKPDAPALRPDWFSTMPPHLARRHVPGRYADPRLVGSVRVSAWVTHG